MSIEPDAASTGRPRFAADHADSESIVTIPSMDPFYRAPAGFERAEPGTVLRSREVTLALFGVIRQKVSAWQLLYRTTSLDGTARVAVTTVVLPVGGRQRSQRALLSYQCAIDAVSDRCFPSYVLRAGARAVGSVPQFEFMIILYALRRGWVVSLPDHEGMDGRWGAPVEPGYCTLDGVRAALSFEPLDLFATTPVALWGYSGGGLATSWAAEAAADYAPELDIVGAALGSPVGDPGSAFSRLNGTIFAALPAMVVEGLRRTYPVLDRLVHEHVAAAGLETLSSLHRKTTVHAVMSMVMHDLERHLDIPMADLLATPEMVQIFQDIQPGKSAPQFPLLVVQAVHDPMIDVDDVDGQVHRYRAAGANVTYIRDRLSEHLSLHPIATPATLDWLSDRFAGKPTDESSTNTVWSLAGSLPGLRGLLGLAVSTGRAFAGRIG
ncbi:lipase family protein [Rhodococcus cercidiphylli]|jgi:pimeloyl-ACP methyl ester carboxylesterase|uniref:Lipase family protein n=1 Tax=Rhodococcus cercidiphylli TaxID=489916 RepID=A0ABU4AUZ3_9NOCA|nr:lipase family protein [Rhodococcus cercidiphylli]MDV6230066.1 lipase family protein [Rhodococcus cercidiphylli]